eukprot:jgi/Astpho2/3431/Aster-07031
MIMPVADGGMEDPGLVERRNSSAGASSSQDPGAELAYPAHRAAFDGNVPLLIRLLKGCSADEQQQLDSQGNTALQAAVLLQAAGQLGSTQTAAGDALTTVFVVLHVAVLRKQQAAVEALLELGLSPTVHNSRRWTPLDEAVSLRDTALVRPLYLRRVADTKAELKAKKALLMESLGSMPDYTMKINWQLGSAVFGLLLRRYAPHDTYTIWKRGTRLRIDGSWMGVDEESTSMIPEWKRGHFSLLFDGGFQPSLILLLDHEKKTWMDLHKEKKQAGKDPDSEGRMGSILFVCKMGGQTLHTLLSRCASFSWTAQRRPRCVFTEQIQQLVKVRQLISDGAGKTKMRSSEFRFKPAKGWLGRDVVEKVEGWRTRVYEAAGKMVAVEHLKAPLNIPDDATFDDYLRLAIASDFVTEIPVDPLSMGGGGPTKGKSARAGQAEEAALKELEDAALAAERAEAGEGEACAVTDPLQADAAQPKKGGKAKGGRKITGKCWMAEDFPMSLKQLLPLMEVVGEANKHLARISKFMAKYGNMALFPVKVQVPLIMTIYALVTFKQFRLPSPGEECAQQSFFERPEDYTFTSVKEYMGKRKHRRQESDLDSALQQEGYGGETLPFDDA